MSLDRICKLDAMGNHDTTRPETASQRLRAYIRDTRNTSGNTQAQCATRAGVPLSTWGTWETDRGTMPSPENLIAIAKGLSVPPIYLLRVVEGLPPQPEGMEVIASSLMATLTPEGKRLVLEWMTAPPEQRRAIEAGLAGLLIALRMPAD